MIEQDEGKHKLKHNNDKTVKLIIDTDELEDSQAGRQEKSNSEAGRHEKVASEVAETQENQEEDPPEDKNFTE